jgi:hypothetical protein
MCSTNPQMIMDGMMHRRLTYEQFHGMIQRMREDADRATFLGRHINGTFQAQFTKALRRMPLYVDDWRRQVRKNIAALNGWLSLASVDRPDEIDPKVMTAIVRAGKTLHRGDLRGVADIVNETMSAMGWAGEGDVCLEDLDVESLFAIFMEIAHKCGHPPRA